jgi:hypothetical protein
MLSQLGYTLHSNKALRNYAGIQGSLYKLSFSIILLNAMKIKRMHNIALSKRGQEHMGTAKNLDCSKRKIFLQGRTGQNAV